MRSSNDYDYHIKMAEDRVPINYHVNHIENHSNHLNLDLSHSNILKLELLKLL